MLDYYSTFPPPNLDTAKREIIEKGKLQMFDWSNGKQENVYKLVSEAFIHSNVIDENNEIKYSFSGWHTFGKNDVMESIDFLLKRRKDKLRRKIRGLLRSSHLLIRIHKASIEKLYHPDSQFVKNVLKAEFDKNVSN